jgi:hypothetical protein
MSPVGVAPAANPAAEGPARNSGEARRIASYPAAPVVA